MFEFSLQYFENVNVWEGVENVNVWQGGPNQPRPSGPPGFCPIADELIFPRNFLLFLLFPGNFLSHVSIFFVIRMIKLTGEYQD